MKKNQIFSGAATALITPMRRGSIDYPALAKILDGQISAGIKALVIGGTTGEAATLSDGERYELYTYVKEKVGGRVKIIFGTGTNDTRMVLRHTKAAEEIGCDGVLIVTPYYNKGTHSGVVKHYKRVAEATELPIILYNVPTRTGVNLTLKQLEELSSVPNIVGIKEASDSVDRLTEISKFGDELYLYAGNDSQIYSTLTLGGVGVISVVSNIFPEKIKKICDGCFEGRWSEAKAGQLEIFDFIRLMFKETNPAPIKYAMSLQGLCSPELRLPLCTPESATRKEIRAEIERIKNLTLPE